MPLSAVSLAISNSGLLVKLPSSISFILPVFCVCLPPGEGEGERV